MSKRVVLDMDSTQIRVYGQQKHSAQSGHFESTCYHPCCCSTARATVGAKLRPGNVHSAQGWKELLLPEIARQQEQGNDVVFRADAAFCQAGDLRGAASA